jgi:hypothetical protein
MLQDEVGEDALARFVSVLASIRRRHLDLLQPRSTAEAVPLQWHGAGPGVPCPACACCRKRQQRSLLTARINCDPVCMSSGCGHPAAQ